MGLGGILFVLGICCFDRIGWEDFLVFVFLVGRRLRIRVSVVFGVLEKCFFKFLVRIVLFFVGSLFWLV